MSIPSATPSVQNRLLFNCDVQVKKNGNAYELTGVITGSNGKSYDVKVVAGSEAEVHDIFANQRQNALAICEVVGKSIKLSGTDFKVFTKSGVTKSGASAAPKTINDDFLQKKMSAIDELQKAKADFESLKTEVDKLRGLPPTAPKKDKNAISVTIGKLLEQLVTNNGISEDDRVVFVGIYRETGVVDEGMLTILNQDAAKIDRKLERRMAAARILGATILEGPKKRTNDGNVTPTVPPTSFVEGLLPKLPVNGVLAGCINTGNSCWLNSALNLMACQTHFDPLLNATFPAEQPTDKEELKNLRSLVPLLKIAVNNLRTGTQVSRDLGYAILTEIAGGKYVRGKDQQTVDILNQHDVAEFLEALLSEWASLKDVSGLESYVKPIMTNANDASVRPVLPVLISDKDATEVVMNSEGFEPEPSRPDIIVNVQRNIATTGSWKSLFSETTRSNATVPIRKEKNLYLVKVNGQDYRVQGVMHHSGGVLSGHWVYLDVLTSGDVVRHSDTHIQQLSSTDSLKALREGTVFYLERLTQV